MAFIRPRSPFMVLRIGQILRIKSGDMLIYIIGSIQESGKNRKQSHCLTIILIETLAKNALASAKKVLKLAYVEAEDTAACRVSVTRSHTFQ